MYDFNERPKLDKRALFQAIFISVKQVVSITVIFYIVVKYPLIAVITLFSIFIVMHTMNTYKTLVMMKNQKY